MKAYKIPTENKDLVRYSIYRNLSRIVLFALYIAMWVLGYIMYLQYPINKPFDFWTMLIFSAMVLISGWWLCRMKRFVTERNFTGLIRSKKISRNYTRGMNRNGKTVVDYHTYLVLLLDVGNRKTKKIKLQLFDEGYNKYYKDGDTVVFFRGLNYPLSLESENDGEHICTVCGTRKSDKFHDGVQINDSSVCDNCSHSLISVKSLCMQHYGE